VTRRRGPRGCSLVALVIVTATAVAIVIFAAVAWWFIIHPYRNAESSIRDELHRLQVKPGRLITDSYADGACFDNCPQLTRTYRIESSTSCAVLHQIAATLRAHGYKLDDDSPALRERNGDFTITLYGPDPCPPWDVLLASLPTDAVRLDVEYRRR
jgi:hypothetical protein